MRAEGAWTDLEPTPGRAALAPSSRRFLLRGLLVVAMVTAVERPAHASGDVVAYGLIFSFSGSSDTPTWFGMGFEGTYMGYPDPDSTNHVTGLGGGAFLHLEVIGFDHFRAALGPQGVMLGPGMELGLAIETADGCGHPTELSVHLGPFLSFGYVGFAGRFDIPMLALGGPAGAPQRGTISGGSIALKSVRGLHGTDVWVGH